MSNACYLMLEKYGKNSRYRAFSMMDIQYLYLILQKYFRVIIVLNFGNVKFAKRFVRPLALRERVGVRVPGFASLIFRSGAIAMPGRMK